MRKFVFRFAVEIFGVCSFLFVFIVWFVKLQLLMIFAELQILNLIISKMKVTKQFFFMVASRGEIQQSLISWIKSWNSKVNFVSLKEFHGISRTSLDELWKFQQSLFRLVSNRPDQRNFHFNILLVHS